MPEVCLHWFALRVWSQREESVRRRLEAQGIETLLPTYIADIPWSDRIKRTPKPLFPGYLFIRVAGHRIAGVLTQPDVIQILGSNLSPSVIPDQQIAIVREIAARSGDVQPVAEYAPGETVTVSCGPFAGQSGAVVRVKNGLRLVLKIEVLNRACSVEIDAQDVKAAA